MAAGAGSPQLKLQVSLDLAFLRNQLSTIGTQLGGQPLQLNAKFNRENLNKELNLISAQFRRRSYRLDINDTSLKTARINAQKLKNALDLLAEAKYVVDVEYRQKGGPGKFSQGPLGAAGRTGGFIDESKFSAYLNRLTKTPLEAVRNALQSAGVQMQSAGKGTIEELRRSILSGLPQVTEDMAKGLIQGLDPKMKESGRKGARSVIDGFKDAADIASPSLIFKLLGKFSADGFEIGFINGLKKIQGKAKAEIRSLIASIRTEIRVGSIGLAGLLSPIGRPGMASTRAAFRSAIPVNENLDPGRGQQRILNSLSLLTGNPRLYRGRMASLGAGNLPSSLLGSAQAQFGLESVVPSFRQARIASGVSPIDKVIDEAFFGRGSLPKTSNALNVFASSIERIGSAVRTALPSGILASASGNARFKSFATPSPSQTMGIFDTTTRPTVYPPSGSFLQFSRRATAISAGLPGNVFGGRGGGGVPLGGGGVPPGGPPGGGGGGGFRNLMGFGPSPEPINLRLFQQARLPLTGAMAELAAEFGNATKQVLLFGTAYKALAFFLDLPNQAFQAAKSLATYQNQLQAVTAETGTFEQSFAFVDTLAQRFNVPLQSARDGFVKLYASMQPAGFDQGQIENLFTGISKATAAFGLSADKVDRVNYAFAQMASKGQIMSEELKGQLGDVLPGALALFAEAAQMSIPEFSKAMEDGAFKGKAMQQVLDNVAILMNTKFGPAAQGASKTLQGSLNQIQNNLKLMYEGLSPIVNQFAAAFGPQVNSLIKDITSAFQALTGNFLEGTDVISTLTPRAASLYQFFQQFGPSVVNAASNIGQFIASLRILIDPLLIVTKGILDFISLPIVARIALYATTLGVLNGAFQLLTRTGIINATVAFVRFALTLNVAQLRVYAAGIGTIVQVLIGMINTANAARLAIMALKLSLASLGVGVVLIALDAVAQGLLGIGSAAGTAQKGVADLRGELNRLAETGMVEEAGGKFLEANTKLIAARRKQAVALRALRQAETAATAPGADPFMSAAAVNAAQSAADRAGQEVTAAVREVEMTRKARDLAFQQRQRTEAQQPTLQQIDLTGGGEDTGKVGKAKKERESQLPLLQLELEKAKELFAIDQQIASAQLSNNTVLVSSLELRKALVEIQYQAKQIALEDIPFEEKKAKLAALRIQYQKEILNSQLQLQIALQKEREEIQKNIEEKLKGYQDENKYQQRYYELVRNGIAPEIAKLQVEIEKTFDAEKEKLDTQIEQLEVQKATTTLAVTELEAKTNLSEIDKLRLTNLKKRLRLLDEELRKGGLLKGELLSAQQQALESGQQAQAPAPLDVRYKELLDNAQKSLDGLRDPLKQLEDISSSVSSAIGNAFKGIISGASSVRDALAGMFQSIADSFADMVAQMISEWLRMQIIKGFQNIFSAFNGGFGAAGPDRATASLPLIEKYSGANGGIAAGGWKPFPAFANGGMVTGPTLGLVGEGRYNEAIVPLPNGKSIPVELGDGAGNQIMTNITVNVNDGKMQGGGNGNGSELGRKLDGAVRQVLIQELRPGGVLAAGRR